MWPHMRDGFFFISRLHRRCRIALNGAHLSLTVIGRLGIGASDETSRQFAVAATHPCSPTDPISQSVEGLLMACIDVAHVSVSPAPSPVEANDAETPTTMPPTPDRHQMEQRREAARQRAERQNRVVLICSSVLLFVAGLCLLVVAHDDAGVENGFWSRMRTAALKQVLIALCAIASAGILFVFCRRHVAMRRRAGFDSALFDCLDLREAADPTAPPDPHFSFDLQELPPVARLPDAPSMQAELRVLSALHKIPSRKWEGGTRPLECSLCMEEVKPGTPIRQLRCEHAFHAVCIDRWLMTAQCGQRRRCPLCNTDPLAIDAHSERASSAGGETAPAEAPRREVWAARWLWVWRVIAGEVRGVTDAISHTSSTVA